MKFLLFVISLFAVMSQLSGVAQGKTPSTLTTFTESNCLHCDS